MRTNKRTNLCFLMVGLGLLVGCVTARTEKLKDAPLPKPKQQELKSTLIGAWERGYKKDGVDASALTEAQQFIWTFKKNGSGLYIKRIDPVNVSGKESFRWHLEGRNLILKSTRTDYKAYFRVKEWSENRMVWYNYHLNNYYILNRRDKADGAQYEK